MLDVVQSERVHVVEMMITAVGEYVLQCCPTRGSGVHLGMPVIHMVVLGEMQRRYQIMQFRFQVSGV